MEFVYFCVIEFKTMAYDKTIYIEQQLTKYLRDYFDGKSNSVYSINGIKVRENTTSLDGLPKGIYIVDGKKIVVK